ncbi:ChaN family lipoprotein [Streptomyces kaniharaensis]|uniref:ChaN family lipoprotein n=1 Tax=Streptomyces kaniharaensis TaxID=212423 RepID=A0A6N7KY99_9ACTN|nr:DUF5682 family protein [Streptomyces kaniharaensis]MQS15775.1 ChaN family lipoprotein [Streptomyces kaniharaensis]
MTTELPTGSAVFIGVRHHSPACARLVADTVEALRPAYVLVEGPADLNPRLDELLLGHELPIAVFSHYRDEERTATSWTPLCDHSPEWVALTRGQAVGAQVRFIDLPAWHPAFVERAVPLANRFADAEARYAEATRRLCRRFGTDSVDALWDRLVEVADPEGLPERLDAYFDLVRGDTEAEPGDRAREEYMARWIRAALARAGGRPVLVVTGGFHTPALRARAAGAGPAEEWPAVPEPPDGALGGSYLVPYSFRQLDAFAGYQSGMPSPGYYQLLWERGPSAAADALSEQLVRRLRARHVPVSTADLIAARSLTEGLAAMRGHPVPARTDVLDGLASALISEALEQPLPWSGGGTLAPRTDPAVVEMVAASTGDRVGRLHPATPAPPLVHDVEAQLERCGVVPGRAATADLTDPDGLLRSQVLHRLRILGIPGHARSSGPTAGADPTFTQHWEPGPAYGREAALIEAGAYGARLDEAASVALAERARAATAASGTTSTAPDELSRVLFDAVLCGANALSAELLAALASRARTIAALGPTGEVLATALHLWRHDRVYGMAGDPLLTEVVDAAVDRVFWLAEGLHGGSGVDPGRLRAMAVARDALRHADGLLTLPRAAAVDAARRIAADPAAPPDLRGAALGLRWSLGHGHGEAADRARSLAAADPREFGDWLAGLFALARDEVTGQGDDSGGSLPDELDDILTAMTDGDFLAALPALRQAFAYFPPRERERIAERLLARRGRRGSARSLLRTSADPLDLARARTLEDHVNRLLDRHGLRARDTAR